MLIVVARASPAPRQSARVRSSPQSTVAVVTAGTLSIRVGRSRLPPAWFGKPRVASRPVRVELEPAADLRLRRRPDLHRPPAARNGLVRRPAAHASTRAISRLRAAASATSPPGTSRAPTASSSRSRRSTRCSTSSGSSAASHCWDCWCRSGRAARARRAARLGPLATLPAAWLAATIGALAGEGFFGGTPLAATFWLVAGVALAVVVPERARPNEDRARDRPAERRRRGALRARTRGGAAAARPRRARRRRHDPAGRGIDGARRRRAGRSAIAASAGSSASSRRARDRDRDPTFCARCCASAGPTCCTRTPRRPARPGASPRCSPDARGPRRSSTPTTATCSAATSRRAANGSSAWSSGGSHTTTDALIAVSDEVRDDLRSARASPRRRSSR